MQVLAHAATRLRDLHAANFVHGAVKPAHILLLPRENRWTLTDFDRATLIGSSAPPQPAVTLTMHDVAYAAPEVVAATAAEEATVEVTAAADCWALGVVAFELLTGSSVLPPRPSDEEVEQVSSSSHEPRVSHTESNQREPIKSRGSGRRKQ